MQETADVTSLLKYRKEIKIKISARPCLVSYIILWPRETL